MLSSSRATARQSSGNGRISRSLECHCLPISGYGRSRRSVRYLTSVLTHSSTSDGLVVEGFSGAAVAGYELLCGFGPSEGLGIGVAVRDPVFDRCDEFWHVGERTSPDALAGDLGEQPFDEIEPRAGCRREVEMEPGMALEPALHGGCLMGGVVVGNEMQVQMSGRLTVDLFQEPEK